MAERYARVAVSDVTYWVDRPYDYCIPADLADAVRPGVRVIVPFSRANRKAEAVVLSVSDHCDYPNVKAILSVLDETPVLTVRQLNLALWMRERFFLHRVRVRQGDPAGRALVPQRRVAQGARQALRMRTACDLT